MSDRGDIDEAADLQARVDRRVTEALEAEYRREREHPGRRLPRSSLGRRLAFASAGVVILVAIVGAFLRNQ